MAEIGVAEKLGPYTANPSENGAAETLVVSLGKECRVSYLEQRLKGQYEQWLMENEIKGIVACDALAISEEEKSFKESYRREADKQRDVFAKNRSAGKYRWMGEICRNSWGDVPGIVQMVYLLLRRCQKDVTQEEAYDLYMNNRKDFEAAMWWALGKELALLNGATPQDVA